MTKDDVQKLRLCIEMLGFYEKPVRESLEDGGQLLEPPAAMLLRAFALGRTMLRAIVGRQPKGNLDSITDSSGTEGGDRLGLVP